MDTSSSRDKSHRPEFHHHHIQRSLSPSDRFCSPRHGSVLTRSISPNRVNLRSASPSVKFSAARNRSVTVSPRKSKQKIQRPLPSNQKRICMCSPTIHPGSFRCSLHNGAQHRGHGQTTPYLSYMRRSAMKSSLVRIGTVESDLLAKRALAIHIRPSSHSLRRRVDFQLRPSRLSQMSKAEDA